MGPQELLYIIPFVAKILESCAKSKVEKKIPSNKSKNYFRISFRFFNNPIHG